MVQYKASKLVRTYKHSATAKNGCNEINKHDRVDVDVLKSRENPTIQMMDKNSLHIVDLTSLKNHFRPSHIVTNN